MKNTKGLIKAFFHKYFESFTYFYSQLKYRLIIVIALSLIIGVLDGFGLTMFLPLLQMINDSSGVNSESLGKLSFLIDGLQNFGFSINLLSVLLLMLVFFFAKGGIQYLAGVYKVNIQQWFIKKLRLQGIKGLNNLSYKYFVVADAGRIQNTLTGEIQRIAQAFSCYFRAFQNGILVLVYMGFAFTIDAQFAILVTLGGVLTNFLYKRLYQNTKAVSRTLTGHTHIFQGLIIQKIANLKYLKATGKLEAYSEKLKQSIINIENSNRRIGKLNALLTSGREPILISVVVSVIIIQTKLFDTDLGPILISLVFFYRALTYLMQMQVDWNKFLSFSGSFDNWTEFSKELKKNKEKFGSDKIAEDIEFIKLSNVHFSYGDSLILKDVSLSIPHKKTLAFVGESGSGKTTLINLIAGLLPVEKGKYFINGIESSEINISTFQKKIGYITQDPVIFTDSIFNNVTFWAEDTPENREKFKIAVRKAAILDFVLDLPNQENTMLGNNGVNLSGGQKQRISIARELFKDVDILILDEATSALDSETEKAIQENIDALKGNYTILIVAHRISTVKNADQIVLMRKGEVSDKGNFVEMMEKSKFFRRMVELQEV